MGKKYIIELENDQIIDGHIACPMQIGYRDRPSFIIDTGIDIKPYTAPDLERVRLEAEQLGMVRAWGAARKIIHMPEGDLLNIFTECYSAVCTALQVILKYDAPEAIEKIRQYEQEKEQQIQVGDEVITASGKAVVLGVGPVHFEYVNADGSSGFDRVKSAEKTGRHFPEIAAILQKMKEES